MRRRQDLCGAAGAEGQSRNEAEKPRYRLRTNALYHTAFLLVPVCSCSIKASVLADSIRPETSA